MSISIESLIVLDAIDRNRSFSAAAKELRRVPSALSYTVQKLETELGLNLFDRRGHRATLTPAGEKLLEGGRFLLNNMHSLERAVKQIDIGWESRLNIATGEFIPPETVCPLLVEFYQMGNPTKLSFTQEVLNGAWDALISGRADLIVGAAFEGPTGGGYISHYLGNVKFVFVVAPTHPLAMQADPLSEETVLRHRAIVTADTSRTMPPRTSGVLFAGQDRLTVPNFVCKREAALWGLGCCTLPYFMVEQDIKDGRLVSKELQFELPVPPIYLAMNKNHKGLALKWFFKKLSDKKFLKNIIIND